MAIAGINANYGLCLCPSSQSTEIKTEPAGLYVVGTCWMTQTRVSVNSADACVKSILRNWGRFCTRVLLSRPIDLSKLIEVGREYNKTFLT